MRGFCFRHPLFSSLLLLSVSIGLQQYSSFLASFWSDAALDRKLIENSVGALFSLWVLLMLKVRIYWWSDQLVRQSYLLLLPMSYLLVNFLGEALVWPTWSQLFLMTGESLLSGFLEEVLLRGCILMLIFRAMPEQGLLRAVLLSSLMFGLAHWANLLKVEADWITVLAQVIYGFFIGVGFAAVYVRTCALMPLILIHGGINMTDALTLDIATEARDIATKAPDVATKAPDVATGPWADFVQIAPVILLCLPLLIYGVFLLRLSQRRRLHFH